MSDEEDESPDAGRTDAEHPNQQTRTAYFGRFNRFEAAIVIEILRDAGIFAFTKRDAEQADNYVYSHAESEMGQVLVDAARIAEARALVDAQLPIHLRSIEDSMRALEAPSPDDAPPESPWGPDWSPSGN
jgi:hypothetical protein